MEEGAKNATINRELAALKRMFMLGKKCTPPKVYQVPQIPMLAEDNIKEGFFEKDEFESFRKALPDYLKGLVTFGYKLGCRLGELQNLKWSGVNRQEGYIRLESSETKNKRARTIYLDDELRRAIREHEKRKNAKI